MSSFEQDGMRAAFEMHLDKGSEQKKPTKGLRNLFGNKSPQKPSSLELPREQQKTLLGRNDRFFPKFKNICLIYVLMYFILGSPRLHRALFRDKSSQQRQNNRSGSQSPGDSGISQSYSSCSAASQCQTFNQSFNSVSSASDWSPDIPISQTQKVST